MGYRQEIENFYFCFNRTFMELKCTIARQEIVPDSVLIVPLWNWNVVWTSDKTSDSFVLIVPLWNWNHDQQQKRQPLRCVLIVPLWNWNCCLASSWPCCWGFNRTFMELKSKAGNDALCHGLVLIVPLWNWNKSVQWRTTVALKF